MSMSLSLLRDFILSVPLVLCLPAVFGVTGPLYSGPIADIVSFAAALIMMSSVFKKLDTKVTASGENTSLSVHGVRHSAL